MAKKNTNIRIQDFRRWSPAKQKAWLSDVSKRVNLPDAALPADLRAKRKAGQQARTEISPGSGVTFGDVARTSKYTEGLTFGEGDRQLKERAANAAMGRTASNDWFKTYQQQVTDASGRAGAAVTAAGENNRGLLDSMNRLSAADTARVQEAVRARARELGQAAPDAGGLEGSQGAAAARASMLASAGIMSNQAAAGNAQFAASADRAAGLANNQNQADWNARDRAIAGDKTAYGEKKGLWRQKFLDDSINAARKSVLEDKVFQMNAESKATAAELAQARADETARANRAREGISQQNANTSSYNSTKSPKPPARKYGWSDKNPNRLFDYAATVLSQGIKDSKGDDVAAPTGRTVILQTQGGNSGAASEKGLMRALKVSSGGKISTNMAQRIIWSWVATNGNTSNMNLKNAPKSWREAVKRYNRLKVK